MLHRDPELRLTSEAALTHPILINYSTSCAMQEVSQNWHLLGLKRTIEPKNTKTIVNLAVEYSYRYPNMGILPPSVAETSPKSSENSLTFHRLTKLVSPSAGYAIQQL